MKLRFLGAAGTVTGSKSLVETAEKRILVDCGLYQGLKVLRLRNWDAFPFDAKRLSAVLVTHAHIDHSGLLPLLVKRGFAGKIHVTHPTLALLGILLPDAGYLQEEDAAFANKHGFSKHHPALPLYTAEEARRTLLQLQGVDWDKACKLGDGLTARFRSAGHILGASTIELNVQGRKILFSGDIGRADAMLIRPPTPVPSADYLVVESTYGNRRHPQQNAGALLTDIINRTSVRGGILLVPAFAVGRTQDLLFLIDQLKRERRIADLPVFVNSPMAAETTHVVCRYPDELKIDLKECERIMASARFTTSAEESRRLNERREPAIIISASGMASGGRILHHLKALMPDARNTILLAGFQAPGTRGEALLHGAKQIKIHGSYVAVAAEIQHLESLSAHADSDGIMTWLKSFQKPPKMTYVNHGEPLASEALRVRIQDELGWSCAVADQERLYELE